MVRYLCREGAGILAGKASEGDSTQAQVSSVKEYKGRELPGSLIKPLLHAEPILEKRLSFLGEPPAALGSGVSVPREPGLVVSLLQGPLGLGGDL